MTTIRKARLNKIGWDENLSLETEEANSEKLSGNQVLVEVEACGVCHRDLIDRDGRFKFIRLPITPGHEAVGRVIAVGPAVTEWTTGDRVGTLHRDFCGSCPACKQGDTALCANAVSLLGLVVDGGYATHLTVPERCLYTVPEKVDAAESSIMHCTFGTSYSGLVRRGQLLSGQRALVTGANGGVGSAAIQVAKRHDAHVIAVVRDDKQQQYLTELGADEVIVDPGSGFHKTLPGGPVDIVVDCVGEPTFNSSLRSLRPAGKIIVIGNVTKESVSLNLGVVVTKGLQIIGSAGATREDMREVFRLHTDKPFSIPIHQRLDLSQADQAQRTVRAGGLQGRIVLIPSND
jgi:acryloyl-coenzyme A reductase